MGPHLTAWTAIQYRRRQKPNAGKKISRNMSWARGTKQAKWQHAAYDGSYVRVRFEPECTWTPFLFYFWSPERRSGPFRHIAAKFRFHLNESDKFALFGSKMPSASGGLRPPDQGLCPWIPLGAPPPDPHIGCRFRARHILSVPVLFLTGNEPCHTYRHMQTECYYYTA